MGLAIGIDLGTTNSVAGVATPQGVKLAVDENGQTIHASVVSFPIEGGLLVGNEARVRKATDPTQTIYSAKRLIGQNVRAPLVQLAMASLAYQVEEGTNQQPLIVVRGQHMMVPEISALILKHLKELCEDQFGEEVTGVVLTVPANFSDSQRQGTKEAGRRAGMEVLRLVNEPTAAALAYGYGQAMDQSVAVYDFGGGTFDFSLLKIDSDIFEVLATDGEFFLGGDDIDQVIAEFLAGEMNRTQHIDPRPIPTAMNRLIVAAEQIKHYLADNEDAGGTIDGIVVGDTGDSVSVEFELSRERFNSMIEGYIGRTIEICQNVFAAAGMDPKRVDDIIMVGGSTRIPLVRERLADFFGKEPANHINPDEVVAHGAAIQAAILSGQILQQSETEIASSSAKLAENAVPIDLQFIDLDSPDDAAVPSALLLDVMPETLRIATTGGYSEAFLEKNSPIPIERTSVFTTAQDDQTRVVIQCCRGTARNVEDNEILGTLILEDIPAAARGDAKIEVTFRVDPDCILHVRAIDLRTNQEVQAKLNVVGAPVSASTEVAEVDDLPVLDKKATRALEKEQKKQKKAQEKEEKEQKKWEKDWAKNLAKKR
ncbi:MAG: Hsp70 family protein [Kofleriaceae bacterium]|nr:Hsp70 family protein [Kofleriaceae bacterium]